jgi:hypothetical protein
MSGARRRHLFDSPSDLVRVFNAIFYSFRDRGDNLLFMDDMVIY